MRGYAFEDIDFQLHLPVVVNRGSRCCRSMHTVWSPPSCSSPCQLGYGTIMHRFDSHQLPLIQGFIHHPPRPLPNHNKRPPLPNSVIQLATHYLCCSVLQCVAVCCSVLQCVAVCCSALQCVAARCNALQCVAVCCSVTSSLHTISVAVCCSVLQCVAV